MTEVFKGYKLKCKDNSGYLDDLTLKKEYIALRDSEIIFLPSEPFVYVTGDMGNQVCCHLSRFTWAKPEPLKLVYKDPINKNKVIMTVHWSKLNRNKHPYLSVNIKDLVVSGIRKNRDRQMEQRQAIKDMEGVPDHFYFLMTQHLTDKDGSGPFVMNVAVYYLKKAQDQHFRTIQGKEISPSDKIDLEWLSKYLSIDLNEINRLILEPINNNSIEEFFDPIHRKNNAKLERLTEVLNIPTIKE